MRPCWCGNTDFLPFNPEYGECRSCGTLVYLKEMSSEQFLVRDDAVDFYGKKYWLEHQQDAFGYADIHTRARNDLTERNLHWLKTLLKYRLPPAKVLELGCSHGSFVALMQQAGYQASGVEMSPWVVEFGQKTFEAPIAVGPIENLSITPGSLDAIALMDVLEHLPDPVATMALCLNLLKPKGLLLIQTPQFREGIEYTRLLDTNGLFLEQLKADEHLYLFSKRSATRLFRQLGAEHIQFEPAIFAHYDMFFVVSRTPFAIHSQQESERRLLETPNGRLSLALLDLATRLANSEQDRNARGEQIETLTRLFKESEADRNARGEQIETLTRLFKEIEQDQAALRENIRSLFSNSTFRLANRVFGWPEAKAKIVSAYSQTQMSNKPLKTIAVDLTPILPGGENGGAKIFVLELLRRLAVFSPQTQFILLTQAASHDELASMDCDNISRRMVMGPVVARSARSRLQVLAKSVLPHLPGRIRAIASGLGHRLHTRVKRGGSRTLLHELGVDLLFCPFTAPTYFEPGIPTVCTIYDLQYKTYPEFFASENVAHRDRVFIEASCRATALTAISDYSRETAIRHGNIAPERIRTIHLRMAQRIALQSVDSFDVLMRLGLVTSRYLIYPANFWKHKNHEMLLTAFGIAVKAGLAPDIKLVCTGAPGERQRYLAQAARVMELVDRVVFPGYLPDKELAALLANARGMLFPSLYEGFGLPIIEAMTAGVPVACSNTTSLPEVAANAAILFDPRVPTQIADAIITLITDESVRDQLVEAGRQRAAEFADADRMAHEYWDLFLYALANEKHENLLIGAYADGWLGTALTVHLAPSDVAQTLELQLAAPAWLPGATTQITVIQDGKSIGKTFELSRGAEDTLAIPLNRGGARTLTFHVTPSFVPAQLGISEDSRTLSLTIQRAQLVGAEGACHTLYPASTDPSQ